MPITNNDDLIQCDRCGGLFDECDIDDDHLCPECSAEYWKEIEER